MILRQRVVHELYYSKTDVRVSVKISTQKDTVFLGRRAHLALLVGQALLK